MNSDKALGPAGAKTYEHPALEKRLSAFDLTVLGIGAIIGAGIFVITGHAAAHKAGPAVMLSFALGAVGCTLAGLCFAELASTFPSAGSAFAYSQVTMGRFAGWIIAWTLILEYTVTCIVVAIGWSGYLAQLFYAMDIELPRMWSRGYFDGGLINIPAVCLVGIITLLLLVGVKQSARAAGVLVIIKLAVIALFLWLGVPHINPNNWKPFMPYGWPGVLSGAGTIFFAYVGFDAVSTASEEAKNPQRDVAIGIIASIAICSVIYMAVALVLTGIAPYKSLSDPAPVSLALEQVGVSWGHVLVTIGAVMGLSSVVLVMMLGQTRILMAMGRAGYVPLWISKIHPKFHTPYVSIVIAGIVILIGAAFLPLGSAGELQSLGALFAFINVCGCVVVLRRSRPELKRNFRVPWSPWLPLAGMATCLLISLGLSKETWLRFVVWHILGLGAYWFYGRQHRGVRRRILPWPVEIL